MTEQEIKNLVGRVVDSVINDGNITLEAANALIEKVKAKAEEIGVKAVVAVADASANPVSVQCMDGAFIASYDIAFNKAYTVTALKMPTTTLSKLAAPGGSLYGIQFTNQGRIVIFGGGVPLYNKNGQLVGGLGVSGGSESEDTFLAEYGAEVFSKGN
ncbi:MAG: heme-binding protein [Clostridia bacterium]|nr:heme-binding protein [Clostridia bacterium]